MSKAKKPDAKAAGKVAPTPVEAPPPVEQKPTTLALYIGTRNELGERHGTGWAHLPNGCFYKGSYRNGMRKGYGLYVFPNGARYIGNYLNGVRHGLGTLFYIDGSVYEGEWKSNQRHGRGRYTYKNGESFEGFWRNGQRSTNGTYTFAESRGGFCFRGTWENDCARGPAEIITGSTRLHCNWNGDTVIGPGTYVIDSKSISNGCLTQDIEPETEPKTTSPPSSEEPKNESGLNLNSDQQIKLEVKKAYWESTDFKPYARTYLPPDLIFARFIDSDEVSNIIQAVETSRKDSLIAFKQLEDSFNDNMSRDLLMDICQDAFRRMTAHEDHNK